MMRGTRAVSHSIGDEENRKKNAPSQETYGQMKNIRHELSKARLFIEDAPEWNVDVSWNFITGYLSDVQLHFIQWHGFLK